MATMTIRPTDYAIYHYGDVTTPTNYIRGTLTNENYIYDSSTSSYGIEKLQFKLSWGTPIRVLFRYKIVIPATPTCYEATRAAVEIKYKFHSNAKKVVKNTWVFRGVLAKSFSTDTTYSTTNAYINQVLKADSATIPTETKTTTLSESVSSTFTTLMRTGGTIYAGLLFYFPVSSYTAAGVTGSAMEFLDVYDLIVRLTYTASNVCIKNSSEWKGAKPYVNANGTWKAATAYINDNGTWKAIT